MSVGAVASTGLLERYELPGDRNCVYVIPVSGGADSTALAISLVGRFPDVPWRLVFTDTHAEPQELYEALDRLEAHIGRKIERLSSGKGLFDLIEQWGGYLPSAKARWCTNHLKRVPYQAWLEQFAGQKVHMFIGIRADEVDRLGFSIDGAESHFPFVECGVTRRGVFGLVTETVGLPRFYGRRTRSGCSVCPFQRKSELVGLLQEAPVEFARGMAYEKGAEHAAPAKDVQREVGMGLSLPMPAEGSKISGVDGKGSLFGEQQGLWVGAEFFFDGFPGMGEFVFAQRVVSYSTSLAGIKRQMQDRYEHILRAPEAYDWDSEDAAERGARFALYFIEAPAELFIVARPAQDAFTWAQGESYARMQHLVSWATRVLHAEQLKRDARAVVTNEMSWSWEQMSISDKALRGLSTEVGTLVTSGWFKPTRRTESELIEAMDERTLPCPMCHI